MCTFSVVVVVIVVDVIDGGRGAVCLSWCGGGGGGGRGVGCVRVCGRACVHTCVGLWGEGGGGWGSEGSAEFRGKKTATCLVVVDVTGCRLFWPTARTGDAAATAAPAMTDEPPSESLVDVSVFRFAPNPVRTPCPNGLHGRQLFVVKSPAAFHRSTPPRPRIW